MNRFISITSGLITMSITAGLFSIAMLGLPEVDPKQQNCLAMNVYHEARSERIEGQIAVAHVTMNRVNHEHFPDNICDVVYQYKQFSWTFTVKDHTPREKRAWDRAMVIARDVMIGNTIDPSHGATFYHANYVDPFWNKEKSLSVSKIIGLHVFYVWTGRWD